MVGRVITFYSYKGGVGRTFAVANVGVILAQWGYRVLVVDWDIEAPGLNHYFSDYVQPTTGVLTYLLDCRNGSQKGWQAYTNRVDIPDCQQSIYLMAAADEKEDYTSVVQALDWDELYNEHALGSKLEQLRSEWVENFDFVLIDSRTGVTDFSGLTTAQLPDILAFLFTANVQSLEGCCRIAERAMAARRKLPIDRPALVPLPLVAKFEQREEYDRAQFWRSKFNERLKDFLDIWAPRETSKARLIDLLTIPYVPRWTFGEDLAALIEPHDPAGVRSANTPISYTLETIAAIIANGFKKIELLSSSRDEYVLTARAAAQGRKVEDGGRKKIFLSYARQDAKIADQLHSALSTAYYDPWVDRANLWPGENWQSSLQRGIEESDAMIVIVGPSGSTPFQESEIEAFLRHALRSSVRKPLIPLLLPGAANALKDSRLADFVGIAIDPERSLDRQLDPVLQRLSSDSIPEATKIFMYHSIEDSDWVLEVAKALESRQITVLLPVFDGPSDEIERFNQSCLRACDAVVLVWGAVSEVWIRAQASGLRDWRQLNRTEPFKYRCVVAGPPKTSRKLASALLFPREDIDLVIDLSDSKTPEPKQLQPLADFLPVSSPS